MERGRTLTVEEARALPPLTEAELAERRAAVDGMAAVAASIRTRLGRDLAEEEFEWALRWDDDDDDFSAK